jgi:cysteinyl-tRNA synthetase
MMKIRLHNTATRRKEVFEPIDPENVRMYVCGPTVYDRAHIGNARPVVVFDVLYRLLRHVYGAEHVTYVRNITDVEDKIIARAAERGIPIDALTAETTAWFHEDMAALGVDYRGDPHFREPKATEYVPQMVEMIETLIARGHAYEAEEHVLFDVKSYADYGALAGRSTDDMIAGARVEVAPYKRDPMDFVLWKPSTPEQPGWDSPWGRGRPGWHIECSAMSHALLGESFDIHGGGADLTFPHHENEVAQSKCAHPGGAFARYWLHNGMIRVEGQKMAKSLGNFITVKDLREKVHPQVIRLTLLSTNYRKALDWTDRRVEEMAQWLASAIEATPEGWNGERLTDELPEAVLNRLARDLDTHGAFVEIGLLRTKAGPGGRDDPEASVLVANALAFLGFDRSYLADRQAATTLSAADLAKLDALIEARRAARAAKDFAASDAIRDALAGVGVELKDTPEGVVPIVKPDFDSDALRRLEP